MMMLQLATLLNGASTMGVQRRHLHARFSLDELVSREDGGERLLEALVADRVAMLGLGEEDVACFDGALCSFQRRGRFPAPPPPPPPGPRPPPRRRPSPCEGLRAVRSGLLQQALPAVRFSDRSAAPPAAAPPRGPSARRGGGGLFRAVPGRRDEPLPGLLLQPVQLRPRLPQRPSRPRPLHPQLRRPHVSGGSPQRPSG